MSEMSAPANEGARSARRRAVRGRWRDGLHVDLAIRDGKFELSSDEASDGGGSDDGPMPSELLFASMASCFAMAVVWVARKRKRELPDLEVEVSWGYDHVERRYAGVEIVATSSLAISEPQEFDLLVRRATDVCWVSRTVRHGTPIAVLASPPRK